MRVQCEPGSDELKRLHKPAATLKYISLTFKSVRGSFTGKWQETHEEEQIMAAEADSPFYHPAALAPHLAGCVVELWRDIKETIRVQSDRFFLFFDWMANMKSKAAKLL